MEFNFNVKFALSEDKEKKMKGTVQKSQKIIENEANGKELNLKLKKHK